MNTILPVCVNLTNCHHVAYTKLVSIVEFTFSKLWVKTRHFTFKFNNRNEVVLKRKLKEKRTKFIYQLAHVRILILLNKHCPVTLLTNMWYCLTYQYHVKINTKMICYWQIYPIQHATFYHTTFGELARVWVSEIVARSTEDDFIRLYEAAYSRGAVVSSAVKLFPIFVESFLRKKQPKPRRSLDFEYIPVRERAAILRFNSRGN